MPNPAMKCGDHGVLVHEVGQHLAHVGLAQDGADLRVLGVRDDVVEAPGRDLGDVVALALDRRDGRDVRGRYIAVVDGAGLQRGELSRVGRERELLELRRTGLATREVGVGHEDVGRTGPPKVCSSHGPSITFHSGLVVYVVVSAACFWRKATTLAAPADGHVVVADGAIGRLPCPRRAEASG